MKRTRESVIATNVSSAIYVALALVCLLLAYPVSAAISPVVKARVIRDFGRISFEWPQEVRLKANTQGSQLRITFEQAADINAAPILRALSPYVTNVQKGGDGRSLVLNLNSDYHVRSFVSGNVNGVDIVGISKTATAAAPAEQKPATSPVETAKAEPAKQASTVLTEKAQPKTKPSPSVTEAVTASATPKEKPLAKAIAKKEKKDTKPPLRVTPQVKPAPSSAAAQMVAKKEKEPPKAQEQAKAEKKPKSDSPKAVTEASAKPAQESPKEQAKAAEEATAAARPKDSTTKKAEQKAPAMAKGKVVVSTDGEDTLISFPWTERTAAAAFTRAGRHFMLFNKLLNIEHSALEALGATVEALPDGNSLVTIPSDKPGLQAEKEQNGYGWQFRISDDDPLPANPIKVSPKAEAPLKPHLFMPVLQTAKVVKYTDPLVGDQLEIVPLHRSGEGMFAHRDFIDASLLKTAQGIVVKPHADELRVARLRNGLKITGPEGLMLTADLPMLSMPESQFALGGDEGTLFPYDVWKTPGDIEDPITFKNQLQNDVADKTTDEKQRARIRLAQWHLAEGQPYEALGLLELIEREDPFMFEKYKLHAYRGAANFLAYRFAEAEKSFAHDSIKENEELKLWRDTINTFFTGEGKLEYLDYYKNYISKYPPSFRQRLALVAADTLVNRKQYNSALKIFDTLNRANVLGPVKDYADYLIAKVSSETRQHEMAIKIWNRLAEDDQNRFVQVRARYALITDELARNEISIEQALEKLEPLRVAWRGDQFEVNLLTLMAQMYETVNEPREALRIYRELLTYYPQRQENLEIAGHMADMFAQLFNEGGADGMRPLDALALYYEFRDLTPVGDEGDRMVRNLANRLVGVDLLDRAADLLDHQVRFRSSGEERSRLGAQLALIHLLNRKPKEALDILEVTGYGRNPEKLQETRALLTARALADLGEHSRALALLDGNLTHDAELLKLRIFWEEKQWADVIGTAENIISQRDDPSAAINKEESEVLLKLAIAYIFEQETEQVQYLRDYFLPLMKENENRDMFAFITQDAPVNPRNMAQLTQHMNSVETFLANYRNRIKEGGLDQVVQ